MTVKGKGMYKARKKALIRFEKGREKSGIETTRLEYKAFVQGFNMGWKARSKKELGGKLT